MGLKTFRLPEYEKKKLKKIYTRFAVILLLQLLTIPRNFLQSKSLIKATLFLGTSVTEVRTLRVPRRHTTLFTRDFCYRVF
jgi:hypothetical protein